LLSDRPRFFVRYFFKIIIQKRKERRKCRKGQIPKNEKNEKKTAMISKLK
jgi:hypothetical protein